MIAVVITTYNNPKSLELCLWSLAQQTVKSFEVFIADDGSGDETRDLILRLKRELPYVLTHHWHPDQGYRKSKINNTVFRQLDAVKYPITVCLDHDVIVHPDFLADHLRYHQQHPGPFCFMGRRIDCGPKLTAQIGLSNLTQITAGLSLLLLRSAWVGDTTRVLRALRITGPDWLLRIMKRDRVYDVLGSNFSVSTRALFWVNGYNETFQSYWGEDGDLFVRLRNSGVRCFGRIGVALQWHLYHKRLDETPAHRDRYQQLLADTDYVRCERGMISFPLKT